ncbi:MAG TPA: glycogen synthase [Jiangellales bacterium]|nr:glycogen synthase [Jiangellales bacterium]
MRVAVLTREFPPYVYGGAGVHVDFLVRELRSLVDVEVHALGEQREGAITYGEDDPRMPGANAALRVMSADLVMASALASVDVVHSHTWYANFAGHVASLLHGVPHVLSAHSLEPLRPWKAEQLGGGYRLSSWVERSAYEAASAVIAVSHGMREDILNSYPAVEPARVQVVHNGIDTGFYRPVEEVDVLDRLGIDRSRPSVVWVGRITRQKGVPHLLRAALRLAPEVQIVLLAGAADTPDLAAETDGLIARLRSERTGVVVVSEMLPREDVRQVLTHATVFVCPSVYEPLGIVNLEAMACETAVVASAVGGIPEVVADGRTGLLVPYDPRDPDGFEEALAARLGELTGDPDRAAEMGRAGRERAIAEFSWDAIAERTVEVYRHALAHPR